MRTIRLAGTMRFNNEDGSVSEPVEGGFAYDATTGVPNSVMFFGEETRPIPPNLVEHVEYLIQVRRHAESILADMDRSAVLLALRHIKEVTP